MRRQDSNPGWRGGKRECFLCAVHFEDLLIELFWMWLLQNDNSNTKIDWVWFAQIWQFQDFMWRRLFKEDPWHDGFDSSSSQIRTQGSWLESAKPTSELCLTLHDSFIMLRHGRSNKKLSTPIQTSIATKGTHSKWIVSGLYLTT